MSTTPATLQAVGQEDPYASIAAAYAHLAKQPQDVAVRGKLAEVYLAVGCAELAVEQLYGVKRIHPDLPAIDRAIEQLLQQPASVVPWEALEAQLAENLSLCRQRWPERAAVWDHVCLPAGLQVFGCEDGNVQARIVRDREVQAVFPFVDHRKLAEQAELPPVLSRMMHNGFLVCSLGLGASVMWLFDVTRDGLNGLAQTITLVEPELENLAINLAVRSWQEVLSAPRVRLFTGPDYKAQLVEAAADHAMSIPSFKVTASQWSHHAPVDPDALLVAMGKARYAVTAPLVEQVGRMYSDRDAKYWADRFARVGRDGEPPLRVMGVTSRMTTVMQYSMRDWLAAFEELGCETRLLMEPSTHETFSPASYMTMMLDFEPDLCVIHNHIRAEYRPWFPDGLPVLSWVQDRMATLFTGGAGKQIGPLDFLAGMGKWECVTRYDYPFEQFLTLTQLTSERAYFPAVHTRDGGSRVACEVSYVSHAGATIESLVSQVVNEVANPQVREVVVSLASDLVERFGDGEFVYTRPELDALLVAHERRVGVRLSAEHGREGVVSYLLLKFASPLLRQTVAGWLADGGIDLHLYGQGWQDNPQFAKYARGLAANGDHLRSIYQGSKINLQIQPSGTIHSRLLDGLASGGFFLIHRCPADELGLPMRALYDYVQAQGIEDEQELLGSTDPQVRAWLADICRCAGWRVDDPNLAILTTLRVVGEGQFLYYAPTVIPEYDRVSFATRDDLLAKVEYFLTHDQERDALAATLRQPVLEHLSYGRGTARMLDFVRRRLQEVARGGTTDLAECGRSVRGP